jgi:hypothetical protein
MNYIIAVLQNASFFGSVTLGRGSHDSWSRNRLYDDCRAPHYAARQHLTRSPRKRLSLSGGPLDSGEFGGTKQNSPCVTSLAADEL